MIAKMPSFLDLPSQSHEQDLWELVVDLLLVVSLPSVSWCGAKAEVRLTAGVRRRRSLETKSKKRIS